MILFDFDYERPGSLGEAVALLAAGGDPARVRALAGGTDLLPNMRVEIARPHTLVSLTGIAAQAPSRTEDGGLRIDAMTTLAALENSELVCQVAPLLAESAHSVAGNQIRQRATLGGNLCQETRCLYLNQKHDYQFAEPCYKRGGGCCYPFPRNDADTCWSVYCSDIAAALIALDATLEVVGPDGVRTMGVESLFTGRGLAPLSLAPGELIGAVVIPPPPARWGWGYHKATIRGGLEFGLAVMAASLGVADDGETCTGARIALTAVDEGPVRAPGAEAMLTGRRLDEDTLREAADAAAAEISPLPHHGHTKSFIRDTIRVQLRRLLGDALGRARA